nr:hypothetical protein [Tanacetum cinerariifolium]
MRPFGCPVTILNTLDPIGKFKGKVDEGFWLDTLSIAKPLEYLTVEHVLFKRPCIKEHDAEKTESAVNLSPSNRNRELNADFKDYSKDSSNYVNAAGHIVPTAGQNYANSTNPISAASPSNTNTSPTHGKSSLKDASQPPKMLEREDIAYSDNGNVGAEADFNNLENSVT